MVNAKISNQQKREWAKLMFCRENLTQKEIAARVGASEVSISKWAKKEKWDLEKASLTITRQEQLNRLYQQIAAINNQIAEREQDKGIPSSSEADKINKLASAIEKMEKDTSISDIINVSVKFLNWVRKIDIEKAKDLSGLFDSYIKESLK